jgi:hypothetical protein
MLETLIFSSSSEKILDQIAILAKIIDCTVAKLSIFIILLGIVHFLAKNHCDLNRVFYIKP